MAILSRLRLHFDVETLRRIFWTCALLTVFLNLADDISIFSRHHTSKIEDSWVRHQFMVRHDFERLTTLFFGGAWDQPETQREAKLLTARIRRGTEGEPAAQEALDDLLKSFLHPPEPRLREGMARYRQAFRDMRQALDISFQKQLDHQLSEGTRTESVILASNVVDLVLILFLLAVYFVERSLKDRIETSLLKSVNDLRVSNQRLEDLTLARAKQLKLAAHDLKTPLAALKGYSELARESITPGQPISRLLQRIDALTGASLEMANTLFAGEAAREDVHNIDLVEILAEVCSASQPLLARKCQRLNFSKPGAQAPVKILRSELMACLHNLLGNAIKFSAEGATIEIRCELSATHVKVFVYDEGPGFRTQDFAHLFEAGQTLSARPTGGETSTGYGLYSTKKTLEAHRGTISVRNRNSRGAAVEIGLPLCSSL